MTGQTTKTTYRAALYCRLSRDDGNVQESSSIQTQKEILSRYARENGINNTTFYVDDGYSGTNFQRPSFQKMIADIESGKINCVITKDLSRLGRNYLETGVFIEVYFPEHNGQGCLTECTLQPAHHMATKKTRKTDIAL